MGAVTSLSAQVVAVTPGKTASLTLRIRNNGTVVDQYDLEVLGQPAKWATVQPRSVSLFPGAEQTVEVTFHPARVSSVPAGRTPFAVRAMSREDPAGSSVEEGVVDVDAFDDRSAELVPRTSQGRRSARHELAVDNRGNVPIEVQLAGVDPESSIGFAFDPPSLVVQPGTAEFARTTVRPAKSFWRGPNRTLPFVVMLTEEGRPPLSVDGSMVQVPILPKWFWKAVAALLALAILLVVLWFALVKPEIETSAEQAVAPVVTRLDAAGIPTVPPPADDGGGGGGAPTTTQSGGGSPTTEAGSPTTTVFGPTTTAGGGGGGTATALGVPFDTRLEVQTGAGPSASFQVPAGQVFSLTDIVFQNPQGDSGQIALRRDGAVLVALSLDAFRLYDLHTIAPYVFNGGQSVEVVVTCTAPGAGAAQCNDAVSMSGFMAGP